MIRPLLLRMSRSPWIEAQFRKRSFSRRAVRRFMPGEKMDDALAAAQALPVGVVLTQLGENVATTQAVMSVRDHYLEAARRLLEGEVDGELSVKPTQLGLDLDPGLAREVMAQLSTAVAPTGGTLWVDMEDSSYVEATLSLVRALQGGPAPVGVCLQAYLHRTGADLQALVAEGVPVRLVKGAYREPPEVAMASKHAVDRAYLQLARLLRANPPSRGRHVLGTHDETLLSSLRAESDGMGSLEVQMLYGIDRGFQSRLVEGGVPLRVLISYGESWFPWYMRRLAERPANLWFVVRSMFRR